jgi:16S rRNA C967 or C1407 C5-methylase (RsmB/RsmF family)
VCAASPLQTKTEERWSLITCPVHAVVAGENEANVRYLLDTHSCLELVPALPRVGGPGLMGPHDREQLLRTARAATEQVGGATGPAGVLKGSHSSAAGSQGTGAGAASPDSLSNAALGPVAAAAKTVIAGDWRLSQEEASMVQRFHPGDPLDTIGFFIARFAKRCSCNCSKSSGRVTQQ